MSAIQVLLLDTSVFGAKGSMSRYARLVHVGFHLHPEFGSDFNLQTLQLSLPRWIIRWLPGSAQVWVNHCWILLTAKFRLGLIPHDIVHLLDGSYAYVVLGIAQSATTATATVHDLIPLLQQKGNLDAAKPSIPARWITHRSVLGLRRCKHLIAVSGSTREDLVRLVGIDKDRISVLQNALDPEFEAAARQEAGTTSTNSPVARPSVLHIGQNASYKNRSGALRIFAKLKTHCQARLVMAGPPPTAALRDLVTALKLDDDVVFVVNPDDAELVRLYQDASVFLFPSIYEGFGWPPLEAMALGCPVVCSSAASLPEVVGDAGLMAPVEDEDELARLCGLVLTDPKLAESLIARGRQRASEFTLERMGAQLVNVYQQLIERGGRL